MRIGLYKEKFEVRISEQAPNEHIAIFGMSGTGKSTRIAEIAESAVQEGKTVIALDLSGEDFQNLSGANHISGVEDGININLLESKSPLYVSQITGIFTEIFRFGVRQEGALRVALQYAVENQEKYVNEIIALAEGLKMQDTSIADSVYNRLWGLFSGNIIRKSNKYIEENKVNVVSFKGLPLQGQREMAELLLCMLWRRVRETGTASKKMILIVDEFQNYVRKNSVLVEMLREARKYNIGIILATQSAEDMSARVKTAINQTAIQLFFKVNNASVKKIAEIIDSSRANEWTIKLKKLQIGESIAVGNLRIGNVELTNPIIIQSEYRQDNKKSSGVYIVKGGCENEE